MTELMYHAFYFSMQNSLGKSLLLGILHFDQHGAWVAVVKKGLEDVP